MNEELNELRNKQTQLKKQVEQINDQIKEYDKKIKKLKYSIDGVKINIESRLTRRAKIIEYKKQIAEIKNAKSILIKIKIEKNKQILKIRDTIKNQITFRNYFEQNIAAKDKYLNNIWFKHFNSFQGIKTNKQLESIIPIEKAKQNGLQQFIPQSRFYIHPKNKALYMLQNDNMLYAITEEGY